MSLIDPKLREEILKRLDPMWYARDAVSNHTPLNDISATDVDFEYIEADLDNRGRKPPTWNEVDQVLREAVEEILTESGFRWNAKWQRPIRAIWPKVTDDPDADWEAAYPDNVTFLDSEGDEVQESDAPCDMSPAVWAIKEDGKDVWQGYISYEKDVE